MKANKVRRFVAIIRPGLAAQPVDENDQAIPFDTMCSFERAMKMKAILATGARGSCIIKITRKTPKRGLIRVAQVSTSTISSVGFGPGARPMDVASELRARIDKFINSDAPAFLAEAGKKGWVPVG